ncbi:DNA adenine methylase [Corynebacterium glucuronolyticum]|uniref:DNA adenine methylase n=1 Tax=Corynebacterium glucuronolyticum TaxID=39791 RepID=UPI00019C19F8|nr:DNA adenine methylase [Corynebacterium glucuronolyticum]EEI27843.1 D12 class N6 adenine-specific DNA methyltransferase [Corynebacterium glucuronolyticum ATCC 51867]MDU3076388.1 DNA adenine methylase [Mixta calida]QRO82094.1 DNA adenine methylase [Corynebacterium glucuronolyticum]
MPVTVTPLRYPGGKSQLIPLVGKLLDASQERIGLYAEPYCGGAGVALNLLLRDRVDYIAINDADRSIYAFWFSVIERTGELVEKIKETAVDLPTWYKMRDQHRQLSKMELNQDLLVELAFSTFFLNRTNHSGIIEAGCIGGKGQEGRYKIDCRFNKEDLIRKIQEIAKRRDRIFVSNFDGLRFAESHLVEICSTAGIELEAVFTFFDPPYVVQGRHLYYNGMSDKAHARLAEFLSGPTKFKWLLSYDNDPLIRELYEDFEVHEYPVRYSANRRQLTNEVLILSEHFSSEEFLFDGNRESS